MISKEFLEVCLLVVLGAMSMVHHHPVGQKRLIILVAYMERGTFILLDEVIRIVTHNPIGIQVRSHLNLLLS